MEAIGKEADVSTASDDPWLPAVAALVKLENLGECHSFVPSVYHQDLPSISFTTAGLNRSISVLVQCTLYTSLLKKNIIPWQWELTVLMHENIYQTTY